MSAPSWRSCSPNTFLSHFTRIHTGTSVLIYIDQRKSTNQKATGSNPAKCTTNRPRASRRWRFFFLPCIVGKFPASRPVPDGPRGGVDYVFIAYSSDHQTHYHKPHHIDLKMPPIRLSTAMTCSPAHGHGGQGHLGAGTAEISSPVSLYALPISTHIPLKQKENCAILHASIPSSCR